MCLGICIFQILTILRLRSELVNARNDKSNKFSYSAETSQKVNIWEFKKSTIENSENYKSMAELPRRLYQANKRGHRSRVEVKNKRILDESKSLCTCPPSGNQVDGLPLAPRWASSGRACMYETRRVLLSSGGVSECKCAWEFVFSDSYHIEASIRASESSKW
jgi:hypothetical protein